MHYNYDVIVIGSGAGGGAAAHYLAAHGKDVAVVERDTIGGECPNFACVPTKALLHAAEVLTTIRDAAHFGIRAHDVTYNFDSVRAWKEMVVSRTGAAKGAKVYTDADVDVIRGSARFVSPHEIVVGNRHYTASKFLIATGSQVFIPPIPGLEAAGFLTFREANALKELPKSVFIIGGGAIGCEYAHIFATFGVDVTIADAAPQLLAREDQEVGDLLQAVMERNGVQVFTNAKVIQVNQRYGKKVITMKVGRHEEVVKVDEILVATGKVPAIDGLDLQKARVRYDKHGIRVNRYMQTSAKNIYAAGDVVGPYLYTHAGNYQSYIAGHNMYARKKRRADYRVMPRCVFTAPEIASVGITEVEAREKQLKYKVGATPTAVLGRSNTSNDFDGFVKVITDAKGRIIGASAVMPRAGEVIHELALAMKMRAKASDVAQMIHAYPTFSEAVKIACASVE